MPERGDTGPASSSHDDAIRTRDVRNWWQIALAIGGGIALTGMFYTDIRFRLTTLEARADATAQEGSKTAQDALRRVTAVELVSVKSDNDAILVNRRLDRIDDQLGTVICLLDKQQCAARLRTGNVRDR